MTLANDSGSRAWLEWIQCPGCSSPLSTDDDGKLRCASCRAAYGFSGRVPDFVDAAASEPGRPSIEVDWDYHPSRRFVGRLRRLYRGTRRHLEMELIRAEQRRLGRGLDVLDIGCGDPSRPESYHSRIRPLSRFYLGIEPSREIAVRFTPAPECAVVRAGAEVPVVRSEVFDLVVCFSTLDHCVDPVLALENMFRALRPGGLALIDLRNPKAWFKSTYERMPEWLRRRRSRGDDPHNWHFTPAELAARLEATGFREVSVYDILYLEVMLPRRSLDWMPRLIGERSCAGALRLLDRIGHRVAPQRGGNFVVCGRKPR